MLVGGHHFRSFLQVIKKLVILPLLSKKTFPVFAILQWGKDLPTIEIRELGLFAGQQNNTEQGNSMNDNDFIAGLCFEGAAGWWLSLCRRLSSTGVDFEQLST